MKQDLTHTPSSIEAPLDSHTINHHKINRRITTTPTISERGWKRQMERNSPSLECKYYERGVAVNDEMSSAVH